MTTHELLDLPPHVGQRAEKIVFELMTNRLEVIGELHPQINGATVSNNPSSAVPRTCQGVVFQESEYRDIDPYTDLVRVKWVLENGDKYSLGVFAFEDDEQHQGSLEQSTSTPLVDLMSMMNVEIFKTFTIPLGGQIIPAITDLVESFGIERYEIAQVDAYVTDPYSRPIGTLGTEALRSALQMAGTLPPYFDSDGVLQVRMPPSLDTNDGIRYDLSNSRVLPESTVIKRNIIRAPNRFIVVGSGPSNDEIVAMCDVDPNARNSKERTGRIVPKTVQRNGIGSYAQAYALASTLAQQDLRLLQGIVFESAPDPRHDTFDVVQFDGDAYLELNWTLQLQPGGTHSHTASKRVNVMDPTSS